MEITVTTRYRKISQKTLDQMISKLSEEWPEEEIKSIRDFGFGKVNSKDPASDEEAMTTFLVDRFAK